MSRTLKDRPYRLGGDRHRYVIADCHNQHGKFKRLMSRLARRELGREFKKDMDGAPKKSKWMWFYFD